MARLHWPPLPKSPSWSRDPEFCVERNPSPNAGCAPVRDRLRDKLRTVWAESDAAPWPGPPHSEPLARTIIDPSPSSAAAALVAFTFPAVFLTRQRIISFSFARRGRQKRKAAGSGESRARTTAQIAIDVDRPEVTFLSERAWRTLVDSYRPCAQTKSCNSQCKSLSRNLNDLRAKFSSSKAELERRIALRCWQAGLSRHTFFCARRRSKSGSYFPSHRVAHSRPPHVLTSAHSCLNNFEKSAASEKMT